MENREEYIFNQLKRHYDEIKDKYEVVGIFLQGSQNYGLDIYDGNYKSDVDTKSIILPTFDDIIFNKTPISTTLVLENNEHIDIKDIRIMFNTFLKQNPNFIEILFTEFKIINPKYKEMMDILFKNAEKIARMDVNKALNCQCGMSEQKYVALKHPYPTIVDKINKFGYDPKQLHHILRMNDFIKKYTKGEPFKNCLKPNDVDYLIEVKKGVLPLEKAEMLANEINEETYRIAKENISENNKVDDTAVQILNDVKAQILKKYFKEQLLVEDNNNI